MTNFRCPIAAVKYQEIEGPPIEREVLESMDIEPEIADHVCRIIANHHSARDIDTPEFRIVRDADWLANIPEEFDTSDEGRMSELIEKVFRIERGRRIAEGLFLERKAS